MRAVLMLALAVGVAAADEPKAKKHAVAVSYSTPALGYTAAVTEVRQVGKELWARVDVTAPEDGVFVIGVVKAKAEFEGPDLPLKVFVFGASGVWNDDCDETPFIDRKGKEAVEKWEKAWKDGKVVFEAKKKDPK